MKNKKASKILIYVLLAIILCVGIFSTIFALFFSTNSKIIYNIKISNVDVSNLEKHEAEEKLEKIIDDIKDDGVILKHGDFEETITLEQIEFDTNVLDKVYEACTLGRSGNIVKNNYEILNIILNGKNISLDYTFNDEIVNSLINTLDENWEDKYTENSYYIDDDKLIITKGKEGVVIDEDALKEEISEYISQRIIGKNITEIEIPVKTQSPEEIDVAKLRTEVYQEPKNASYDKETSTLTTHVNGVEIAITDEEVSAILAEDKEEYEIPLKIITPEITTDKLGDEAFPYELATFSTRYDASNVNRSTNIELAASAINGKVLLPGETFSFNGTVGPRTKAKGYKMAGAYSAGELIETYGGGVCQVSSTLYNSVLYANLEIVERSNHSSKVSYVDCGRDATVSYGSKDFKFKNSRTYAIKIQAEAKNGILTMKIRGIKEDDEYEIELTSEIEDVTIRKTTYIYDSTLGVNDEVVTTIGADGAKSIAYKITKKNGKVISKEVLSEDIYNPMTKVVRTGDKSKV